MRNMLVRMIIATAVLCGVLDAERVWACQCNGSNGKPLCTGHCCQTFGQACICADSCS